MRPDLLATSPRCTEAEGAEQGMAPDSAGSGADRAELAILNLLAACWPGREHFHTGPGFRSRESRMFPDDNRRACDNQGGAGEIRPEGPSRKPRRADPNGKFLVEEMLNAERHDGQGEKVSPDSEERKRCFALRSEER